MCQPDHVYNAWISGGMCGHSLVPAGSSAQGLFVLTSGNCRSNQYWPVDSWNVGHVCKCWLVKCQPLRPRLCALVPSLLMYYSQNFHTGASVCAWVCACVRACVRVCMHGFSMIFTPNQRCLELKITYCDHLIWESNTTDLATIHMWHIFEKKIVIHS